MEYIECPKPVLRNKSCKIFLAGGITGCPDWQQEATEWFKQNIGDLPVEILNPRRANFNVADKSITEEQITWEFTAMGMSDIIFFWFPKESECPITLYELGRYLALYPNSPHYDKDFVVIIGIHPDYPRKEDVVVQTTLATNLQPDTRSSFIDILQEVAATAKEICETLM